MVWGCTHWSVPPRVPAVQQSVDGGTSVGDRRRGGGPAGRLGVVLLFRRAAAVLAGGGVVLLSRRAAAASAGGAVGRDFHGSSVLLQDRQPYMECTPLKDLSRNSYRWKVMVRVARIWEFRSSDQSTLFSLEFIVVDQQKSVMEGVVLGNRVDQFKDQLKEGSVYTIDKFDLYDPKKTYRSVDNPFRICFTMRTLLAEVVAPPENFPMFAHSALPFSVLTNRINSKIVLSDVVGLVTKVTDVLPPSGKAKSQKRLADLFDADGLMEASAQEPVIILFVGMTVSQYSGLLAFKSTSVTRWYVNVPIPEIAAVHERSKHLPYRIQLHDGSQGRTEPIVSSIAEISTFEPNDIMGERYKISVKITEVLSEDGWHRFVARAIDTDIADIQSAKSADLYFFGPRGDAIVGKDASALVSSTRGQSNSVPPELLAIVGKEYNVVVTPRRESLDALYSHLQVQIVDPIIRASTALRQATADRTADKNDENSTVPQVPEQIETAGQASTPPPSTDLTPSKVASSGSAVDKVPSSSSGRGKRKNSGSTTSPKSKKTLQFPGNN
ncbi:hypothetical protein ACQ4PT_066801 [Festuca glaucescens]